jgi:hypothetical protein
VVSCFNWDLISDNFIIVFFKLFSKVLDTIFKNKN